MILAEFNPTILFFLLWGLLSWFAKKKKNQHIEKDHLEYSETKPKEDLFSKIQKLQDHFSTETEIFPLSPERIEPEEEYIADDDEISFEKSEVITPSAEDVHVNIGYSDDEIITISATKQDRWLKKNLSQKSELRKLMVLKEVLGDPRALKPYTGVYFQL